MTSSKDATHGARHDRFLKEWVHDTYKSKKKPQEPSVCKQCGAFFHAGHWQWGAAPAGAGEIMCPACHRIADHVPAGILTMSGGFVEQHRDEILNLIRNIEEREKSEHPLKRIMTVEDQDEALQVTFTDPHLARGAGEAVRHAYQGDLDYHYVEEDTLLRLHWRR